MHMLATLIEARAIANSFGLTHKHAADFANEVLAANKLCNTPFAQSSRDACDRNAFYMRFHKNSYRSCLNDPREIIAYWYVQEADDGRMEALDASDFEDRAYGYD